jgi:two-component system response regulator WspF
MRIAIVNDVFMAVEAMRRVIAAAPGHQVAWVARDGREAVERCAHDRPDLILMDLIMPKMDGIEATRRIMAATPCAIVVVTASVGGNSSKVFEAMGAGALDAVNTPVLESPDAQQGADALLGKIETIRKLLRPVDHHLPSDGTSHLHKAATSPQEFLVAIGASAGGPAALAKVLSTFPQDFPAPVVVVQHVDVQFARGLGEWLDSQSKLKVRLAEEGDQPSPGTVLLAGEDRHLVFTAPNRLGYTREPVDCSYRPSIDVFFQSAKRFWRADLIGVLLTGMGRDGAEGLRSLRNRGFHTIAQDAASCAVYGMPKAAAELHAASEVLPLASIGPRLVRLVSLKTRFHV